MMEVMRTVVMAVMVVMGATWSWDSDMVMGCQWWYLCWCERLSSLAWLHKGRLDLGM